MLSIFDLEKNGPIPHEETDICKNHVPEKVWEIYMQHIKEGYPIIFGLREDVGHYLLSSGQGPFVIWMENPQQVDGPHPYNPNLK